MTEAGPGILWSVMPLELVLGGEPAGYAPSREMWVEGRLLEVEPLGDGTARVIRLHSGNAQDYLDPRFQPGTLIPFSS